ncbi:glycosyl hydrolase 115 family protein [Marinimicrobium alkaliphilum]|uniref:glycosyl hydrolase 115 family protein n=1 Tax=Marinimicrobium alkaliphilum TaxID=2202654 RepID=UPI000DBA2783|nr:glycosyl hydrolase 115 family protein [Marinimicrobium alkaliphilum]
MTLTRTVCALAIALLLPASNALAMKDIHYVNSEPRPGDFVLVGPAQLSPIYVDDEDHGPVRRAAGFLRDDIERVTGQRPRVVRSAEDLSEQAVIIGTVGQSALIDRLVAEGKIDPSGIEGEWDAYHKEVVDNPLPGVERALVIVGSNRRGAAYGAYDVSEHIGVSPWYWWADVPIKTREHLYIAADTRIQEIPGVKYRGIFLNNEWPALTTWVHDKFDGYHHEFYEHVFELIVRLKGNFLWPTMWNNAFADEDELNMILAHEYGVVVSTSHHEPMMRWDKEWDWYGEGAWEFSTNAENLKDFWREGPKRHKGYDSIYTLGMRGQEDTPMAEGQDIALLESIVDAQREILSEVFDDRPLEEVPQVWALYKEVQYFYEAGMRVPDDVILLWANDNFGNHRRLPTPEERERAGGAGVYYHFDYVGGPRSYRWINTMPLKKMWEQMHLAWEYQADQIWLVNVGDLKPMEYPIDYFLRMAWDPEYWDLENTQQYGVRWATRNFGAEYADDIYQLITDYTRHNGRRKPEAQDKDTYSVHNYREAERIYAELADMVERADALYERIPERYRDTYEQLVRHKVRATANTTKMYIDQARNHLYAAQGRRYANEYGDKVRAAFEFDAYLEERYHALNDGKWDGMMLETRIGYNHWNRPVANVRPVIHDYQPHAEPDMGVAVEGMARAWPVPGPLALQTFTPFGQKERRITVYNRGTAPFDFTAEASDPWINISASEGEIERDQVIEVSIDWRKAPTGKAEGSVFIQGTGWGGATVAVHTDKPEASLLSLVEGAIEADGYVSLDAGMFDRQVEKGGYRFDVITHHGRTGSSISAYPISDESTTDLSQAPYVEYDVYFFSTGEFTIHSHFAPSLNFVPGRGIRYGIGFAGEKPQVVDFLDDLSERAWEISVLDNIRTATSTHTIDEPGLHRLRFYRVDPGATLQNIVIDTGGLKPTYLGPPPSRRR